MAQHAGRVAPKMRHISLLMLLAFSGGGLAWAADTTNLDDVVVSANRIETSIDSVPATVTKVDRKTMDKRMPHDQAALFEDDPDVVVGRNLGRFGASTVNIRGLEADRVVQMVDGVRLPDYYNGGGPANASVANSSGPEIDFLKRVEVIRGPSSSLYGSDGLGGTVSYVTLDPRDIAKEQGVVAGRYKGTWREADKSFQNTLYGALVDERWEGLLAVTNRQGHELANKGEVGGLSTGREQPNPQDNASTGVLAKLVFKPGDGHKFKLSYEERLQQSDGQYLRRNASSTYVKVQGATGSDVADQQRYGLDWEWLAGNSWFDRLQFKAYHQDFGSRDKNLQTRTNTTASCSAQSNGVNNCLVDMRQYVDQQTVGLNLQFDKETKVGDTTHLVVTGIDWRRHFMDAVRDYTIYNNTTGTVSKSLAGDTYPLRDFAPGTDTALGLFGQDEIKLGDSRVTVTPGARLDWVDLSPNSMNKTIVSTVYTPQSQKHVAVSPKLSASWDATPTTTFWGQIAKGFRAPKYSEVNGMFWNSSQFYAILPNADLKPETSISAELGAKIKVAKGDVKLAVYDNRYTDFINSMNVVCRDSTNYACLSPSGTPFSGASLVYQPTNVSSVRIRGAEARMTQALDGGFSVGGAFAYAEGTDLETGKPLNSIEPMRLMMNLAWQGAAAGRPVGGDVRMRAASRKSAIDTTGGANYFETPAYAVFDLGTWWEITPKARINLAVNNLFDQQYWLWSDVRQAGLYQSDPGTAFYTQPGRNVSASLQVDF